MLIHPTVERLRALGLTAMADIVIELQNNPEAAEMPHPDWPGLLVDREVTARDNRRLTCRLTNAKLRQAATIENVDYRTARGLDRSLFQTLASRSRPLRWKRFVGLTNCTRSSARLWAKCRGAAADPPSEKRAAAGRFSGLAAGRMCPALAFVQRRQADELPAQPVKWLCPPCP
ncbi:hypothetical protein ACVIHF_000636 [Bradyrhizobium sp. USDA 4506]